MNIYILLLCCSVSGGTYPKQVDHSILSNPLSKISYTGFIPISAQSKTFYWLFLSDSNASTKPVLLWLQGQIGVSTLFGVLEEFTPEWSKEYNLLFVDAPIGTGFSEGDEYATSSEEIAAQVVYFLNSFYKRHGSSIGKELIIAGEDYAGHTIPVIASLVLFEAEHSEYTLIGTAVGNGHTHAPIQVITKAESAAIFGLVDGDCLTEARQHAWASSAKSLAGNYIGSLDERNKLEETILKCAPSVDMSHVDEKMKTPFTRTQEIVDDPNFLASIGIEKKFVVKNPKVLLNLNPDIMKPVWQYIPGVLHSVPTLWYQGQLDWVDGVYSNEAWINALEWSGAAGYANANRTECPAGYLKEFQFLSEAMVRGAGHLALKEKPSEVLNLFKHVFGRKEF